jgi:ATP-dependent helicase/nuclease subunit A
MIKSPDHLQRLAADPDACVWVTASAGTGKTKVLTDRVLNLLLEGAEPQRILCLTFTRAAAGEMQNRLHQRLSEWVVLSPGQLKERITTFLGRTPTAEQLLRARTLFPIVLDSPGGMKIQTIHGFCQSVLKRFPLEASLTPNFQVLDETLADHLLQKVQDDLLRADKDLRPYLAHLTDIFDDGSFSEMLGYLMGERHKWSWLLHEPQALKRAQIEIERLLGISLADDAETYMAQAIRASLYSREALTHGGQCLLAGSETDQQRGTCLLANLKDFKIEDYMPLFLTADGEVRKRLATKKVLDKNPEVLDILITEAERMQVLQNRIRSLDCGRRTWAIVNLGVAILQRYSEEKKRRGQLDYNDLIEHTARLLRLPDVAPWVLFKLDGGLDHILVDEAQDTNLHQWTVISSLAEEFFSGSGAREHKRTLFVVGDLKQSIYSFQGANPYVFDGMRKHFTKAIQAAEANWREVQLNISFRSTQAVLAVVDKVFEQIIARDGVAIQEELIEHHSFRKGQGGVVEVWPLVAPEEQPELAPWSPPIHVESQDIAPQVRLAHGMAAQIKQWLDHKELLLSRGRPIRAGDIMVLVRRRSGFVEDLVRALKQMGVPVAGADRMDLLAHLAVQDLIAIGRFVIQPLDDLNLACVLKGPLVNLSEEELFALAHDRGEQTLWNRLTDSKAYTYLAGLRELSQTCTPFDFYATLLGAMGAREALVTRLGYESLDPMEEFLNVVQNYQQNNVSSLLGFLNWLSTGELEVKRDLEHGEQNEVRIMTVHGSKGLQAPIVFLPDTVQLPRHTDRILWASCGEHARLPIWAPPSQAGCEVTDQLKQGAQHQIDQEYRRLMYVAMTRAEDRLYVCGWQTQQEPVDGSWYKMIQTSLMDIGQPVELDFSTTTPYGWKGTGYRYSCPQLVELETSLMEEKAVESCITPSWLQEKPSGDSITERPLRPSIVTSQDIMIKSHVYDRGTVIHKLLQYLPDVPADLREKAGWQLLKTMPQVPEGHSTALVDDVLRVLESDSLKDIFSSHGRAEVPITGTIHGKVVSGQVDRLVVLDDEIIIVDYKTHRVPPTNVQEIPTIYLHQLSTYKEVLQRIYPHHTIRCILLWTQTLDIMEIPQYMLTNCSIN